MDTGVLKGSDLCLCCTHIAAHNGSRMAQALAALRGLSEEDVQRLTLENGRRLYRI